MTAKQQQEALHYRRLRYTPEEIAAAIGVNSKEVYSFLYPNGTPGREIIPRRHTQNVPRVSGLYRHPSGREVGTSKPRGLVFRRWGPVETMSHIWPLVLEQWQHRKDMACVFSNFEISPEEQLVCLNHLQKWFPRQ